MRLCDGGALAAEGAGAMGGGEPVQICGHRLGAGGKRDAAIDRTPCAEGTKIGSIGAGSLRPRCRRSGRSRQRRQRCGERVHLFSIRRRRGCGADCGSSGKLLEFGGSREIRQVWIRRGKRFAVVRLGFMLCPIISICGHDGACRTSAWPRSIPPQRSDASPRRRRLPRTARLRSGRVPATPCSGPSALAQQCHR